jgi:hypothetical protein
MSELTTQLRDTGSTRFEICDGQCSSDAIVCFCVTEIRDSLAYSKTWPLSSLRSRFLLQLELRTGELHIQLEKHKHSPMMA